MAPCKSYLLFFLLFLLFHRQYSILVAFAYGTINLSFLLLPIKMRVQHTCTNFSGSGGQSALGWITMALAPERLEA